MAGTEKQSYTVDGITVELDPEVFESWELLELQADMAEGNPSAMVKATRLVLGGSYDDAIAQLKGDAAMLSVAKVGEFWNKLGAAVNALKN